MSRASDELVTISLSVSRRVDPHHAASQQQPLIEGRLGRGVNGRPEAALRGKVLTALSRAVQDNAWRVPPGTRWSPTRPVEGVRRVVVFFKGHPCWRGMPGDPGCRSRPRSPAPGDATSNPVASPGHFSSGRSGAGIGSATDAASGLRARRTHRTVDSGGGPWTMGGRSVARSGPAGVRPGTVTIAPRCYRARLTSPLWAITPMRATSPRGISAKIRR